MAANGELRGAPLPRHRSELPTAFRRTAGQPPHTRPKALHTPDRTLPRTHRRTIGTNGPAHAQVARMATAPAGDTPPNEDAMVRRHPLPSRRGRVPYTFPDHTPHMCQSYASTGCTPLPNLAGAAGTARSATTTAAPTRETGRGVGSATTTAAPNRETGRGVGGRPPPPDWSVARLDGRRPAVGWRQVPLRGAW